MSGVYHKVTSLEETRRILRMISPEQSTEKVRVRDAVGRMTAEAVIARRSVPHYLSAGYDGYATYAPLTFGATESTPKELRDARPVSTGDPLKFTETCVVPLEDVIEQQGRKFIYRAFFEGSNVRQVGEDIIQGDMIIPARHWIEPIDVALMLAAGVFEVEVIKKPKVAIIPTGDEIRVPESDLTVGEIPETNSSLITSELSSFFDFHVVDTVPNNMERIRGAIEETLDYADIVATIAGSSRGEKDLVAQLLRQTPGAELMVHGVNIKPGKPFIVGRYGGKPFIGFPGFPVSTWVILRFVLPALIEEYYGYLPEAWGKGQCIAGRKLPSDGGTVEYIRGVVGSVGGEKVFMPLSRGAGVMSSVVRANGIVEVPAGSEGYVGGTRIVALTRYDSQPLMAASDDLALKFLLSELRKRHVFLNYVFTGSASALELFEKGLVAAAGAHLLCPDGTYNSCMIKPGTRKVAFVRRQQGLVVPKGNPKGISGIEDLARADVVMVNREKGSGTRILLDYLLAQKGISGDAIRGFDNEEYSHLRVAMAVATGLADVGVGIKTAADAMGLDFVPMVEEEYDLFFSADLEAIADQVETVVRSMEFRSIVERLGGYRVCSVERGA